MAIPFSDSSGGLAAVWQWVRSFFAGWWKLAATADEEYEDDPGRNL
jgi:hypothetical protein